MNRIIVAVLIFVAGLGIGYFWGANGSQKSVSKSENYRDAESQEKDWNKSNRSESEVSKIVKSHDSTQEPNHEEQNRDDIPEKVLKVLRYVDENGTAPDGYVGGRRFKNLEGLLPKKDVQNKRINYQEWDVNPKIEGKNRGKERLVTGDDQSAYFTNDHYQSFKKIK
jgi:ribonuclease T1